MTAPHRIGVLGVRNVKPAITAILAELHRLGADALPRAREANPSIWWEEKVLSESARLEAQHVPGDPR